MVLFGFVNCMLLDHLNMYAVNSTEFGRNSRHVYHTKLFFQIQDVNKLEQLACFL